MDRLPEAEALYRETVERWPNEVVARSGLADTLKAMDRLPEAEALYRETIEKWPTNRVALHSLANVLRAMERFDEALRLLPDASFATGRQNQYDMHLRGMILLESGDVKSAISIFEGMLEKPMSQGQQRFFRSALAVAKLKAMDSEGALNALAELPENDPVTDILKLHAYAVSENTAQTGTIIARLESLGTGLKQHLRSAFQRIMDGYCLISEKICHPPLKEYEAIIRSEVEMLMAA